MSSLNNLTLQQLQKKCAELGLSPCRGKGITKTFLVSKINDSLKNKGNSLSVPSDVTSEKISTDHLSLIPGEVIVNEILTKLDFPSLISYCRSNKTARKQCERLELYRALGLDHRRFQDLLLYLVYNDEPRLFRLLVDNSEMLGQVVDDVTYRRALTYFIERNDENMQDYISEHAKITPELVEKMEAAILLSKKIVKIVASKSRSKSYQIDTNMNGVLDALYPEYLSDLIVNSLSWDDYKWIYNVTSQYKPGTITLSVEIIGALLRKNDMKLAQKANKLFANSGIWRLIANVEIISEGSVEQVKSFFPNLDNEVWDIWQEEVRIPVVRDERLFYEIASIFYNSGRGAGVEFLSGGYRSTDPYEWIDFVEKMISEREIEKLAEYYFEYTDAKKQGYSFWDDVVKNYLTQKRDLKL